MLARAGGLVGRAEATATPVDGLRVVLMRLFFFKIYLKQVYPRGYTCLMPEAHPRIAQYFELTTDDYPAKNAEAKLEMKIRALIRGRIVRAELGNYGKHRRLDGDFLELKEMKGPGYRVYLGEEGRTLLIILLVGDKSVQAKDIKLARSYWAMHKQRKRRSDHAA